MNSGLDESARAIADALALAAGELMRILGAIGRIEADQAQQFADAMRDLLRAAASPNAVIGSATMRRRASAD